MSRWYAIYYEQVIYDAVLRLWMMMYCVSWHMREIMYSHALAWRVWFKNFLRLTYLWLCQSKSLSLRGTKDQNSSILGSELCVDLGFRGDFRPRGHKFWASCHLPKALGLQKLNLRNVCRRSNIEAEIAGPRYINKKLDVLTILKLNYKEQEWNPKGMWESG